MAQSLADELAARSNRPGPRCRLGVWLAARDNADAVIECFQRPDVTSTALGEWLTSEGFLISRVMVDHHRRGRCATCTAAALDLRRRP